MNELTHPKRSAFFIAIKPVLQRDVHTTATGPSADGRVLCAFAAELAGEAGLHEVVSMANKPVPSSIRPSVSTHRIDGER
jgi:hypothetical protein